jgi:hypothetical protein
MCGHDISWSGAGRPPVGFDRARAYFNPVLHASTCLPTSTSHRLCDCALRRGRAPHRTHVTSATCDQLGNDGQDDNKHARMQFAVYRIACSHDMVHFKALWPWMRDIPTRETATPRMDHGRIRRMQPCSPGAHQVAHTHVALSSRWLAARRARSTAGGLHCPPPHSARAQALLMATQRSRHSS